MNYRPVAWVFALLFVLLCSGVALASGGEGSMLSGSKLVWRVIDGIVLIAILVWLLKKPLARFFSERTEKIDNDLREARELREQAERTIRQYEAKIAGMEQELDGMRAELRKAAGTESERLVANADRMAAGMVQSAKLAAEQEVRKAKSMLRNEAVDLAVQLAEALIREKISEDDRKKIVEEYLENVGGMK